MAENKILPWLSKRERERDILSMKYICTVNRVVTSSYQVDPYQWCFYLHIIVIMDPGKHTNS